MQRISQKNRAGLERLQSVGIHLSLVVHLSRIGYTGPRVISVEKAHHRMDGLSPLLVYTVILVGFVIANLVIAHAVGPRKKTLVKQMPYESGMDPINDARQRFDIKFYLVAILFLVFDVELLFLYPWAVSAFSDAGIPEQLRDTVYGVMLVFMFTLSVAYIYAWRKGVFKWR